MRAVILWRAPAIGSEFVFWLLPAVTFRDDDTAASYQICRVVYLVGLVRCPERWRGLPSAHAYPAGRLATHGAILNPSGGATLERQAFRLRRSRLFGST